MSTVEGGQSNIVTNSLVLFLDAANNRSYPSPYTGTSWFDISFSSNLGTLVNGTQFISTNSGCLRCDGSNDYIEVTDSSSLDFGASNFTVEYWFRKLASSTGGSRNIWGPNKWNTGANPGSNEWILGIGNLETGLGDNYSFGVQVGNNFYRTSPSVDTLSLKTWYQLVGIRDGGTLRNYLNGVAKQTATPAGFSASSSINNVSGRNLRMCLSALNSLYVNCDTAILRIYNKALSQQEVLQNFNATRARFGI